jgi:hypothetical protein
VCQRKGRCNPAMGTKSREVIWGARVSAAKMNAESARQRAVEADLELFFAASKHRSDLAKDTLFLVETIRPVPNPLCSSKPLVKFEKLFEQLATRLR